MANYDVIFIISGLALVLCILMIILVKRYHKKCEHEWDRLDDEFGVGSVFFRCDKCGSVKCEEDKELKWTLR